MSQGWRPPPGSRRALGTNQVDASGTEKPLAVESRFDRLSRVQPV